MKPAPAPKTEIERKVADAAAKSRTAAPITVPHVLVDGDGQFIGVRFQLDPDGRWREVYRTDATGRFWAEQWLADEVHQGNVARRNG